MRPLIFVLMAGTGLLACNGGSDSDTPASASADTAPAAAHPRHRGLHRKPAQHGTPVAISAATAEMLTSINVGSDATFG